MLPIVSEYRRVSHSGLVGGFNSLLSTFPDMRLAVFTSSNGDMNTYDFHEALHIYAADVVFEETPWLNDTTACTYPEPWAGTTTTQSPLDQLVATRPILFREKALEAAETEMLGELEPLGSTWLRDNHERYVGHFGHLLLGNLSVYYNDTEDMLWGTAGRIGIGQLLPFNASEELFLMEMWDALWWLPELTSGLGSHPPIRFADLQGEEYQEIVAIAYDPQTPPIFVRGLQWDDLPEDETTWFNEFAAVTWHASFNFTSKFSYLCKRWVISSQTAVATLTVNWLNVPMTTVSFHSSHAELCSGH